VEDELFEGGVGVESGCCCAFEEGDEYARFFWEDADGFEGAKVDEVEELVDGGGCGEVADVDGAACGVCGGGEGG